MLTHNQSFLNECGWLFQADSFFTHASKNFIVVCELQSKGGQGIGLQKWIGDKGTWR